MLNWRSSKKHKWSDNNRAKAIHATNGGLDVEAEVWEKLEKLLSKLPAPAVTYKTLKSA